MAFAGAGFVKGKRAFSRSLAVRDVVANRPVICERQFFGLFSAQTRSIDLDFGRESWPIAIGEMTFSGSSKARGNEPEFPADGLAKAVVQGGSGKLLGVPLGKWSMKYFASARIKRDEQVRVHGDLRCEGKGLAGGFVSRQALYDCLLVSRAGVYRLGDLRAGSQWKVADNQSATRLLAFLVELKNDWDLWQYVKVGGRELAMEPQRQQVDTGSPGGLVRMLAATSLHRMLTSWERGLRVRIRDAQFKQPAFAWGTEERRMLDNGKSKPGTGKDIVGQAKIKPLINISVPQVWSMLLNPDDRYLSDLSDVLWRGGVVLFARTGRVPNVVRASDLNLERQGETLVRVIFSPGQRAHGGDLWQDDLY